MADEIVMPTWRHVVSLFESEPTAILAVVAAAVLVLVVAIAVVMWRRRRSAERPVEQVPGAPDRTGAIERGLAKTRASFLQRLMPLLGRSRLDPAARETLEAALLAADVGVRMTERLLDTLVAGPDDAGIPIAERLKHEVHAILAAPDAEKAEAVTGARGIPRVVMVVGVNGVGKTTTIGKLAARFVGAGERTLMVAADTFRAAAIEQLGVWAERTGSDLVRHQHGADPGAVAYDGMRAAVARGVDVVLVDTAGRLHTKTNLMDELRKVRRVIAREIPGAPHETLLVIDAVTGQNGLVQGRAFLEQIDVTGVVLTKLDGTAKGGIAVAIAGDLGLPIRYVGVGEGVEDLREFSAREFAEGLVSGAGT